MRRHFLTTPLVAGLLLLSALGCSKTDDPAANANATGSYQLDNTTSSCQAKASTSTGGSGGVSVEYLTIDLITTPQPATGAETLRLHFAKPNVQGNTTYTLIEITLVNKGITVPYSFFVTNAALTPTGSGGFSGTFSGTLINPNGANPAPYTTIANGKFTNVRP